MISPESFYGWLNQHNVDFFAGVPDSLLKDICAYITSNTSQQQHIIAANEGNAIALAAGYHMATGKIPLVYMQNSGIGNAVNPLLSLTDKQVYNIPILLMIGWRGEPGVKDEPQHVTQGEVTLDLLKTIGVPCIVLSNNETEARKQVEEAIKHAKNNNSAHAIVVRKGTFEKYSLQSPPLQELELSREDAIKCMVNSFEGNEVVVSTTGKTSRELFEYRASLKQTHASDFLTVGSMGHSSQLALSIALSKPKRKVVCIDGDGALIMHMGGMATIGKLYPNNLVHVVINNGAHESVGGQPTVAFDMDIPAIAIASGYKTAKTVWTEAELLAAFKAADSTACPALIEIRVRMGSRDNLGRPTIKPADNKLDFMKYLED